MKKPRTMLDEEAAAALPANLPVNPDLTTEMIIDVAVNKQSEVWVFHNRPFPKVLDWVEYDMDDGRLIFVTRGGRLNDFGVEIGPVMKKFLRKSREVLVYLVYEGKIYDFTKVPLVTRNTMH